MRKSRFQKKFRSKQFRKLVLGLRPQVLAARALRTFKRNCRKGACLERATRVVAAAVLAASMFPVGAAWAVNDAATNAMEDMAKALVPEEVAEPSEPAESPEAAKAIESSAADSDEVAETEFPAETTEAEPAEAPASALELTPQATVEVTNFYSCVLRLEDSGKLTIAPKNIEGTIGVYTGSPITEQLRVATELDKVSPGASARVTWVDFAQGAHLKGSVKELFAHLPNLKKVTSDYPNVINSTAPANFEAMFKNCSQLSDISGLANWDTSAVTSTLEMFQHCLALTNVDALSEWKTQNLKAATSMFDGCANLANINGLRPSGPNVWDTTNLVSMGSMFKNCARLADIAALASWNTAKVQSIGYMFEGAISVPDFSPIASWNTSSLVHCEGLFAECSQLTSVSFLAAWATRANKIVYTNSMFLNCTSLKNADGLSWNVAALENTHAMFKNCTALQNVNAMSSWNVDSLTEASEMFLNCSSLSSIEGLRGWSLRSLLSCNRMFKDCSSLRELGPLSSSRPQQVSKADELFRNCVALKSITGIDNWRLRSNKSDNPENAAPNLNRAFENCRSLTSIEPLRDWTQDPIIGATNIFADCIALTDATPIQYWNFSITDATGLFKNCPLVSIAFNEGWRKNFGDVAAYKKTYVVPTFENPPVNSTYTGKWCSDDAPLSASSGRAFGAEGLQAYFNRYAEDPAFNVAVVYGTWHAQTWEEANRGDLANAIISYEGTEFDRATDGSVHIGDIPWTGGPIVLGNNLGVELRGRNLAVGTHYTATYADNTNIGEATITLTAKAPYTGTKVVKFSIKKILKSGSVALELNGNWLYARPAVSGAEGIFGVPNLNNNYGPAIANVLGAEDAAKVTKIILSGQLKLGTSAAKLFANLPNLGQIALQNATDSLSVGDCTSFFELFANDEKLANSSVALSPLATWDTSKVTNIASMFKNCKSLTYTTLKPLESWPSVNSASLSNVTVANYMFMGCTSLTKLDPIAGWRLPLAANFVSAFEGCTGISGVSALGNWNLGSNTNSNFNRMFAGCTNVTTLTGLEKWNTSQVVNTKEMFEGCTKLTSTTALDPLQNWNVSSVRDMSGMFKNCAGLTTVSALKNWNMASIGAKSGKLTSMLEGCPIAKIEVGPNWSLPNNIGLRVPSGASIQSLELQAGDSKLQGRMNSRSFAATEFGAALGLKADALTITGAVAPTLTTQALVGDYSGRWVCTSGATDQTIKRSISVDDITSTYTAAQLQGVWEPQVYKNFAPTIDSVPNQMWHWTPRTPALTVKDGATTLTKDVHYTVAYENHSTVGTAKAKVTGLDGYLGTFEKTFQIDAVPIAKSAGHVSHPSIGDRTYTPRGNRPPVVLSYSGQNLREGTDYNIAFVNGESAGPAEVNIQGKGGFTGTEVHSYTVNARDLADAQIRRILGQEHTGQPIEPKPVVTVDGVTLTENTDYQLSYADNVDHGTATCTVTGMGNYAGERVLKFQIAAEAEPEGVEVYRLYNPYNGDHFFTLDANERDVITALGWRQEGIGFTAPKESNTPVYRFYSTWAGDHMFTASETERQDLIDRGWTSEGIAFYSDDREQMAVYRQYNPYEQSANHHWTEDLTEHEYTVSLGWQKEGIGWYAIPTYDNAGRAPPAAGPTQLAITVEEKPVDSLRARDSKSSIFAIPYFKL